MKNYQVLIIGAGTAGVMVAAQLKRAKQQLSIALIDPSDKHYYQPAFTLVGANAYKMKNTIRPQKDCIPAGVDWIKAAVSSIDGKTNSVQTNTGEQYEYDILVVCPGLVMAPQLVKGLSEALGKGVVCSNYTNPEHTWQVLKNFKGGTALFTQPTTPIKCGGAPQKIMYLADDHFRKTGVRAKTKIVFATPKPSMFPVTPIRETLMNVVDRKDLHLMFGRELVEIDADNQVAWYDLNEDASEYNSQEIDVLDHPSRVGIKYDMIHLAPPQAAPAFIADSGLADEAGWMSVNMHSMQSTHFDNMFGLGDVSNLPTSKTGAAVRKQVPVVTRNILEMLDKGQVSDKQYNGYTSCPLVTGYGKMVLAEFDYDKTFTPDPKLKQMLLFNSDKEHWRLWMLKKYGLPYLYWNKMMKGVEV